MRNVMGRVTAAVAMTIAAAFIYIAPAKATSGYLLWCQGAVNCAMGGAGIAIHGGVGGALNNPASLARAKNEFMGGIGIIPYMPTNVNYQDENGVGLVNSGPGDQKSAKRLFYGSSFGLNYRLSDTVSIGFVGGGTGGLGGKFAQARFAEPANAAILDDNGETGYDTQTYNGVVTFSPTIAWAPTETLAVGLSAVVGYSRFKSNSAIFNPDPVGVSTFVQTKGRLDDDDALGLGLRIGAIWDVTPEWGIGFAMQSPIFFEPFEKYDDLLIGSVDSPGWATVGVVWHQSPKLDIAFDFRVQFNHWTRIISASNDQGGFGWANTNEFALGASYELTEKWTVRAGVNYSDQIIEENEVFANSLSPLVEKWKFDIGGGYKIDDHDRHVLNFSAHFMPRAGRAENGNSAVGAIGKGTTHGHIMAGGKIAYTYRY